MEILITIWFLILLTAVGGGLSIVAYEFFQEFILEKDPVSVFLALFFAVAGFSFFAVTYGIFISEYL
jgi:hypothetical protein